MPLSNPTATQMIEAVRSFLEKDILTSAKGRQAFDTKVAINALMTVERELADGPGLDSDERKRLVSLLGHEGDLKELNTELADAISQGTIDTASNELVDHLYQTVLGKMQVDNPRYATFKKLIAKSE